MISYSIDSHVNTVLNDGLELGEMLGVDKSVTIDHSVVGCLILHIPLCTGRTFLQTGCTGLCYCLITLS